MPKNTIEKEQNGQGTSVRDASVHGASVHGASVHEGKGNAAGTANTGPHKGTRKKDKCGESGEWLLVA